MESLFSGFVELMFFPWCSCPPLPPQGQPSMRIHHNIISIVPQLSFILLEYNRVDWPGRNMDFGNGWSGWFRLGVFGGVLRLDQLLHQCQCASTRSSPNVSRTYATLFWSLPASFGPDRICFFEVVKVDGLDLGFESVLAKVQLDQVPPLTHPTRPPTISLPSGQLQYHRESSSQCQCHHSHIRQ